MARESYGGSNPATAGVESSNSHPRFFEGRVSGERFMASPGKAVDSEEGEGDDERDEWRHSLPPPEPWLMEDQDRVAETQEELMAEILELRSQRRAARAELEVLAASLPALEEESLRAGVVLEAMRFFYEGKDGDMHRGESVLDYDIVQFAKKYNLEGLLDERGKLPSSPKRRRLVVEDFLQKQLLLSHDPEVIRAADGFLNEYRLVLKTVTPLEEEAEAAYLRLDPVQQRVEELKQQLNSLAVKEARRMKKYGDLSRLSQEELVMEQKRKSRSELLSLENIAVLVRILEAARSPDHMSMSDQDESVLRQVLEEYVNDERFMGSLASAVARNFGHHELEDILENLLDTTYGDLRRVSQERQRAEDDRVRDESLFSSDNVKNLSSVFEALRSFSPRSMNHRVLPVLNLFLKEYTKDPSVMSSLTLALGGKFKKDELETLLKTYSETKYKKAA